VKSSLIITCYNQHKYLKQLLSFLEGFLFQLNQTEIIIVDSTCENFEINSNLLVTYFKIANNGPSAARNFGSTKACGEWLVFCDADDFVNPFIFPFLLRKQPIKQIFLFDFKRVFDSEFLLQVNTYFKIIIEKKDFWNNSLETKIENPIHFLKNFYPVHAVAYSKDLFLTECFDEKQWFIEDVKFNLQLLRDKSNHFFLINNERFISFHRDFVNRTSLSNSNDLFFWEGVCKNYQFILQNFTLSFKDKWSLYKLSISTFHTAPIDIKKMVKKECKEIFKKFRILDAILKNEFIYKIVTFSITKVLK
jgi:glycosyltransferase involved in cell wall biosynthesis